MKVTIKRQDKNQEMVNLKLKNWKLNSDQCLPFHLKIPLLTWNKGEFSNYKSSNFMGSLTGNINFRCMSKIFKSVGGSNLLQKSLIPRQAYQAAEHEGIIPELNTLPMWSNSNQCLCSFTSNSKRSHWNFSSIKSNSTLSPIQIVRTNGFLKKP